jgi:hypothetical protein
MVFCNSDLKKPLDRLQARTNTAHPAVDTSRLSFQQHWRSVERRIFELDHVVALRLGEVSLDLLLGKERLSEVTRLRIDSEKMWRMEIVGIVGLMRPIMVEM